MQRFAWEISSRFNYGAVPSHCQVLKVMSTSLAGLPEMRSGFAERVAQGFYLNVEVNRAEAARYGLTVGDVQRAITSGTAASASAA